jgi:ADP-ribose pyrophosphatase
MENNVLYSHPERRFYLNEEHDYYIYEVPQLVAVLPVLPDGNVLLIEQFRPAINARIIELVTGGMKEGEDPLDAAVREVLEETGYETTNQRLVGTYFSTPGYTTQKVFVVIAELGEFVGSALEAHEEQFNLKTRKMTIGEAKTYMRENVTHPFLPLALLAI